MEQMSEFSINKFQYTVNMQRQIQNVQVTTAEGTISYHWVQFPHDIKVQSKDERRKQYFSWVENQI